MTTVNEGVERLNTLVEILTHVKNKSFDLSAWGSLESGKTPRIPVKKFKKQIAEGICGTTACACGHAGLYKPFRKLGFKLKTTHNDVEVLYKDPDGHTFEGFEAAAKFFAVDLELAEHLFDPEEYKPGRRSRYYVIRRIKSLVKQAEKLLKETPGP